MSLLLPDKTQRAIDTIIGQPGSSYLFVGPRNVGKTTAALHVAGQVTGEPSNITHLVPTDKRTIGIGQIHSLEQSLQLKLPSSKGRRVIVVEDAEALTLEAQNAFLKTLEEPPANTTIILTSAYRARLLPTIVSRCKIVSFYTMEKSVITDFLRQTQSDRRADTPDIAALSRGAVGTALTLLNDATYREFLARQRDMAQQLLEGDLYRSLIRAEDVVSRQEYDPVIVAEQLSVMVSDQLKTARDDRAVRDNLQQLDVIEQYLRRTTSNMNAKLAFNVLVLGLHNV